MGSADGPKPEVAALLSLLGPVETQPAYITRSHWHALDAIADQHRLRPILHGRLQRGTIRSDVPRDIASCWAESHRAAGLTALVQRRDLMEIASLLSEASLSCVAVKGAWLAWHVYAAPAERPLRDLDLLVAEQDAPRAWRMLLDRGLQPTEALHSDPVDHAKRKKQFPPLQTSSGTMVELHAHLWEPPGSMEWPTPPLRDKEMMARAIAAGTTHGLHYLEPSDMLVHLALHAAYSHRFEVGPLLLSDIELLVGSHKVDWNRLWREADEGGYLRGTALVIALVDRWSRPGLLTESSCPLSVEQSIIIDASELLCQPLEARRATRSFAAANEAYAANGLLAAAIAIASRASTLLRDPRRLASRIAENLVALGNRSVADSGRRSASVGRWLERGQ